MRRSGPPKVTLAIHGRDAAAGRKEHVFGDVVAGRTPARARRPCAGSPSSSRTRRSPLRREHEQLVGVDERAPQVAVAVEGDAVRPRALAERRRAEDFALDGVPRLVDAQARDAAAGGLDDVEKLLPGVEADFVGEAEAVGHDAERAVFVAREVAVGQIGAQGVHPVLHPRRDRDPDAVLASRAGRS